MIDLSLDLSIASDYKSTSQIVRRVTEKWVGDYIFCPQCASTLGHCPNNSPVADFFCLSCGKVFELKSKSNNIGVKIVDGAYDTMIERIQSSSNPDFFFLNYDNSMQVKNFFAIPNFFFVPEIIERRKALAPTAKRAGWVGCNILLQKIPQSGKIFYIQDYNITPKEKVLHQYQNVFFMKQEKSKGWILEIMQCIDRLHKSIFSLTDLYVFEKELQRKYPNNQHIQAKIRQQVQFLRDRGYLEFLGNGKYSLK